MEMQLLYYAAAAVVGWLARHWGIGAPASPGPAAPPVVGPAHPLWEQLRPIIRQLILDELSRLGATARPPATP